MRGLAEALAAAGFTVELPAAAGPRHRGRGHARHRLGRLVGRRRGGLPAARPAGSSGSRRRRRPVDGRRAHRSGSAARHPEIAGHRLHQRRGRAGRPSCARSCRRWSTAGQETMPGIGSDIADPDAAELAYDETPLRAAAARCSRRVEDSQPDLATITVPGPGDDQPAGPRRAAGEQRPPRRRRWPVRSSGSRLERSYHVATLDYDKDLDRASRRVEFAAKVTVS